MKTTKNIFTIKKKLGLLLKKNKEKSNPIKIILAYSDKKIKTKPPELYSVLNPDTSSDSLSEKSKGVRLHSANLDENQIIDNKKKNKNPKLKKD